MSNDMLMLQKIGSDGLLMKCDESNIDDLIWILERLVSMSKTLRQRMRYVKAYERAEDEQIRADRKEKYDRLSVKVYKQFRKFKSDDLTYSQAIYKTRKALGLGYEDTCIYVRNGKKVLQSQGGE